MNKHVDTLERIAGRDELMLWPGVHLVHDPSGWRISGPGAEQSVRLPDVAAHHIVENIAHNWLDERDKQLFFDEFARVWRVRDVTTGLTSKGHGSKIDALHSIVCLSTMPRKRSFWVGGLPSDSSAPRGSETNPFESIEECIRSLSDSEQKV